MTDRWNDVAHRVVRIEMVRQGLTYADLTERLRPLGVDDNERNIRNKVARGTFSGVFLIQCLAALGVRTVDLSAYHLPFMEDGTQQWLKETKEQHADAIASLSTRKPK